MDFLKVINKSFGVYNIRGIEVEPTYWQAGVIVLLLFLLVFTLARVRYLYIHWSTGKSATAFLLWGFLLAILVEGLLMVGGRTLFTTLLGWENAPKPISTALNLGREKLVDVLGVEEEIINVSAGNFTYQSVIGNYQSLSDEEKETVRFFLCQP